MNSWYSVEGKDCDVALYTKLTISRNIKGFPFPNRMDEDQCSQVTDLIVNTLTSDEVFAENFRVIEQKTIPEISLKALKERELITEKFITLPLNKTLILSNDENVSIMLCGEDHIKVTVLAAGLDFEKAFIRAEELDALICSLLPIAFDDKLGFLTESPMDLGTALRAEVLLHLPTLEAKGEIRSITDSVSRIGLSIKGVTNSEGYNITSFYKLTNLITLGITERTAIENLNSIVAQIVNRERIERESADKIDAEDSIFRAIALLKSARRIDCEEMETLLSKFKTGISYGLIKGIPQHIAYELMTESKDGMLQSQYGEMSEKDLDIARSEHIKKALANINI